MVYDDRNTDSTDLIQLVAKYEMAQQNKQSIYMESEELMDIAEFYYNKGSIHQAIDVVDYAINIHPTDAMPLIFRSRLALIEESNIAQAKKYAEMVTDKTEWDYHYLLAEIMIMENHTDQADNYLRERMTHIEDEDDIADFILDVTTIFVDYKKYDMAETWLNMSDDYELPDYKELKGRIAMGQGNYKRSERIFEELIDKDPYSNVFWNRLASAQLMQSRMKDSIDSSEYAIAINPEDREAIINKANALFSLYKYEEALEYYKRYTKLFPEDHCGYLYQGNSLVNLNRLDEAVEMYKTAEQKAQFGQSNIVEIYQELALSLSSIGRTDEALEYISKAENASKGDKSEYEVMRGHVYLENGNIEKAQEHFREAVEGSYYSRKILINIAISAMDCDYITIAYKMLKWISKINDDKKKGLPYLALCCYNLDKKQEFLAILKRACEEEPEETKLVIGFMFPAELGVNQYYDYMVNHME